MTNQTVSSRSAEDQDRSDAWAYDALGEEVPPVGNQAANASNDNRGEKAGGPTPPNGNQGEKATGASNGASPKQDQAGQGENDDPLAGHDLDSLLKHKTLGPLLNAWNDKTTNSRLQSERTRLTNEIKPQIKAEVEFEEAKEYLNNLSDEQRGQALARDPALARTWAKIQEADERVTANPEQIAASAQVYALATVISQYDALVQGSTLPDDVKAQLLDTAAFEERGAEGINEWSAKIMRTLVDHEKEAAIKSELDTRWESYKEDNSAKQQGARPALSGPGRRQEPRPDIVDGNSSEFLDAFKQ